MVSYVLNDNALFPVQPATRERVLQAIETLGYVPDKSARTLRTRKTYTIAVFIEDITNPFFPAFLRGIQDVAEAHGYDVIIYNTDGAADKERKCLRSVQNGRVDGVILSLFALEANDLQPLLETGIPVVHLGAAPAEVAGFPLDSVYIDDSAAARTAVTHLIERGHRRIGAICGPENIPVGRARAPGYRQALAEADLPSDARLLRRAELSGPDGYRAARELLELAEPPTAIFAANDLMAIGAMSAIKEAQLRIPADVAVVGFDDIPAAALVSPPLTTIESCPEQSGNAATILLLDRLSGRAPEAGLQEVLPFRLIVRGST